MDNQDNKLETVAQPVINTTNCTSGFSSLWPYGQVSSKPMSTLIFKKMNDVMKEIKAVTKDQTNTAQGFKFRGIDQFVNALYPALTKHGVFMTVSIIDKHETIKDVTRSNGKAGVDKHVALTVRYTFHAEDGSSVHSEVASEGLDSGDKATNKALSAALKYCLIQTFSIPTEDMAEADLETPEMGASSGKDVKFDPTSVQTTGAVKTTAAKTSFRKTTTKTAETTTPQVGGGDGWT